MKNKQNLLLTVLLVFSVTTLFLSCSKSINENSINEEPKNAKLKKMQGDCTLKCVDLSEAAACNTDCIKQFMNDYSTAEIKWTSCSDDFGIPIAGCNGSVSFTSKVKFCWGHSPKGGLCYVYMEIDKLPYGKDANGNPTSCLSCLTKSGLGPICVKMKVSCEVKDGVGTITLTEDDADLNGDTEIGNFTVTITSDPKITFCCVERIGGGGMINRCCTGDIY